LELQKSPGRQLTESFCVALEEPVRPSAASLQGVSVGGPEWQSIRPGRQSDACAGALKHLRRGRWSLGGLFFSGYPELTSSCIWDNIKDWSRRASFVNSRSRARVGVRHGAACLLEGLPQAVPGFLPHSP